MLSIQIRWVYENKWPNNVDFISDGHRAIYRDKVKEVQDLGYDDMKIDILD